MKKPSTLGSIALLALAYALASNSPVIASPTDPRYLPITPASLAAFANNKALSDVQQFLAIAQARTSGLALTAAKDYDNVADAKPSDARANMFAAMANYSAYHSAVFALLNPGNQEQSLLADENACFRAAPKYADMAYKLDPESPRIAAIYGYIHSSNSPSATSKLAILVSASKTIPDAMTMYMLGYAYDAIGASWFNGPNVKSTKYWKLAAQCYLRALALDPTFADAHWMLRWTYADLNNQADSIKELNEFTAVSGRSDPFGGFDDTDASN